MRERSPGEYSMLRTSVVPTMLKAGVGANVIPSEAEATLDIRALPGEDIDAFYAEMAKVIARSCGQDRAAAADPSSVTGIQNSDRNVPDAGACGRYDLPGCHGAAVHVHRRQRPGAAPSEGHPVLRHWACVNRIRRD